MVGSLRPMDTGRRTEHCAHGGRAVKAAALPGELDATATSCAPRGGGQGRRIAPSESELVSAVRCRERDHGSPPQLIFFSSDPPWVGRGRAEGTGSSEEETDGERRAAFMPITSTDGEMETRRRQQGNRQQQLLLRASSMRTRREVCMAEIRFGRPAPVSRIFRRRRWAAVVGWRLRDT